MTFTFWGLSHCFAFLLLSHEHCFLITVTYSANRWAIVNQKVSADKVIIIKRFGEIENLCLTSMLTTMQSLQC